MSEFSHAGWGPVPEELLKLYPKISVSGLCLIAKSPAHYESRYILKEETEETDAMKLGTAVHMALLEPKRFDGLYCLHPGDPPSDIPETNDQLKAILRAAGLSIGGTKAELIGRIRDSGLDVTFYDEWFSKRTLGREVLKPNEWRACHRIVQRVSEDPELQFQISEGEAEKLGWALHARTQTLISFKADYVRLFRKSFGDYGGVVCDVKKVQAGKADERRYGWQALDANGHIQAAAYCSILSQIYGLKMMFTWVLAEEKPPYSVLGVPCDFGVLDKGLVDMNLALDKFRASLESGKWPTAKRGLKTIVWPEIGWKEG